ncbi:DedA family protein [Desulfovibrio sp. OttesenSCG-928-G15]|nr:DedA family protein [Desulfovibrio sp. OttesenSCG-928-G15]
MDKQQLGQLFRKYWYIVIIFVAVIAVLVHLIAGSGKEPAELLREYGYLIILIWTFLEGETIVIIAGATSGSVGLEPWLIALSAFCGSFLSDQVMFSLGKYKGEEVLGYFPRIAKNVDKAAALFKKYDTALILGFRFVYGVRNVTPILLGISGVSHKKFFFLNFIGASVWAITFTYGGLLAGEAFRSAMEHLGHGIFYILLALLAAGGILWYIRARRNVKHAHTVVKKDSAPGTQMNNAQPGTHADTQSGAQGNAQPAAQADAQGNTSDASEGKNTLSGTPE